MGRGRPPGGPKFGGRQKGTPNKSTTTMEQRLAEMGCNPFELMATIALNQLPCGVCRGALKTKFRKADKSLGDRRCESCYGTGFEACAPELRGKMAAELASYLLPKRKAIEVAGDGGGPLVSEVIVRLVE